MNKVKNLRKAAFPMEVGAGAVNFTVKYPKLLHLWGWDAGIDIQGGAWFTRLGTSSHTQG